MPVSPLRGDPPTGEPDAGEPPVRFGGRGKQTQLFLPTPIRTALLRASPLLRFSVFCRSLRHLRVLTSGNRQELGRRQCAACETGEVNRALEVVDAIDPHTD